MLARRKPWAGELLQWVWRGRLLEGSIARAKYVIAVQPHEVLAHVELRDVGGRRRAEIGSFASVGEARAACERDAVARCRRDREERGPVPVRISPEPVRRRAAAAAKAAGAARAPAADFTSGARQAACCAGGVCGAGRGLVGPALLCL